MGILNSVFGSNKEAKEPKEEKAPIPWKQLTAVEQLDQIVSDSSVRPVAIFKHSTTCAISRMVLRQLESQYEIAPNKLDIYYLDLKVYRDVSNEIASRFMVAHESPQLILIKNGTAVYADSHGSISIEELETRL